MLTLDNFNEGKDWSDDPAVYRRWGYLTLAMMGTRIPAELFEEKSDDVQSTLKKVLEAIKEDSTAAKSVHNLDKDSVFALLEG